jgi:hypothetical protein
VFEKVNTGGVNLTAFELLTATFAADDFSLRDDWDARRKRLKEHKALGRMQSTDFLQAIALLVTYSRRCRALQQGESQDTAPGIRCKRKDILRLTVDQYCGWADRVEVGFTEAVRFLHRQKIFSARDVPYRTQIVPLAAVLTWMADKAEPDGVQTGLAQWYWCGVLGELYGSAVESRFARDLPEVVDWILHGGALPKTIEDANFVSSRLYTLRTRNSAAYKGIHALLMRSGCQDFRTGHSIEAQMYFDDQIDIHHIFPRKWCYTHGIQREQRDSIVNKTPIAARTNRKIGGNAPSDYLAVLQRSEGISKERMDAILGSHAIDSESVRSDDFQAFFRRREAELLDMIEQAMGKPAVRETVISEFEMDDDYEGAENELDIEGEEA